MTLYNQTLDGTHKAVRARRCMVVAAGVACILSITQTIMSNAEEPKAPTTLRIIDWKEYESGYIKKIALSLEGKYIGIMAPKMVKGDIVDYYGVYAATSRTPIWLNEIGKHEDPTGLFIFSPDGRFIVIGMFATKDHKKLYGGEATIKVVESKTGKVVGRYTLPAGRGRYGLITPDGKRLVVAGMAEAAAVHDAQSGKEITVLKGPEKAVREFNSDDSKEEQTKSVENQPSCIALSNDGNWLAIGTSGGWVSVWDVAKRRRVWRERGYEANVEALSFSPSGDSVASSGRSRIYRIIIWDRLKGHRKQEQRTRYIRKISYHPKRELILIGRVQNETGFIVWDPVKNNWDGRSLTWSATGPFYADFMALSCDGSAIALATQTQIRLFDLKWVSGSK